MPTEQKGGRVIQLSEDQWAQLAAQTIATDLGLPADEYFVRKDAGQISDCDDLNVRMVLALGGETSRKDLLEKVAEWDR